MIKERGVGPRVIAHSIHEFRGVDCYNETHEEFQEFRKGVYSQAEGSGRKLQVL